MFTKIYKDNVVIKNRIRNENFCVSVDETTDATGRQITNLVIGI